MTLDSFITVYTRYGITTPRGRWLHKYAPVNEAEKKEAKKLVEEYARIADVAIREEQFGGNVYISLFKLASFANNDYVITLHPLPGETLLDAYVFMLSEIAFCAGIKTLDELKIWLDIGCVHAKRGN